MLSLGVVVRHTSSGRRRVDDAEQAGLALRWRASDPGRRLEDRVAQLMRPGAEQRARPAVDRVRIDADQRGVGDPVRIMLADTQHRVAAIVRDLVRRWTSRDR